MQPSAAETGFPDIDVPTATYVQVAPNKTYPGLQDSETVLLVHDVAPV